MEIGPNGASKTNKTGKSLTSNFRSNRARNFHSLGARSKQNPFKILPPLQPQMASEETCCFESGRREELA